MLKHHRAALFAVFVLVISGVFCIGVRIKYMTTTGLLNGEDTWRLTYEVEFRPEKPGTRFHIAIPSDTISANITSETFSHKKLLVDTLNIIETGNREAVAVAPDSSTPVKFTAQFDLKTNNLDRQLIYMPKKSLTTPEKLRYLRNEKLISKDSPGIVRILNTLSDSEKTKNKLIQRIFEYCSENTDLYKMIETFGALTDYQKTEYPALSKAVTMVALCRAGKMPARLVTGFILENSSHARPYTWVEVYYKNKWIPYDPHNTFSLELPSNYLPVRRDGKSIVKSSDGSEYFSAYSIERLEKVPFTSVYSSTSFWNIFDLTRLPIGMKKTTSLLLLLPAGALITAFFRNLIGIQTFGTFTPTLLALSLVNSDWRIGAIIFVIILSVGLFCRMLLNRLMLLAVPRLGIILTLVVLSLVIAVSACERFGLAPTARSILLPVVIMTMMIERFFITFEEDGSKVTMNVLFGTSLVTVCCFILLNYSTRIGQVVLTFPELQLFVAAAFVLIGRYSGYRLTELWRFRDVAKLKG